MQVGSTALSLMALALLVGSCGDQPSPPQKKNAALPDFERLESLAEKECLCRMAERDTATISDEFKRLTKGLVVEDLGSASAPLSATIRCYPEYGRDTACVTESYRFVMTDERDFVCTSAQADELEAIWAKKPHDPDVARAADTALLTRLKSMRKEVAAAMPQDACDNP